MARAPASVIVALLVSATALASAVGARDAGSREFGHSVHGRDLRAVRIGDPHSQRLALVVGSIHGDEREGHEIIRRLRRSRPAVDVELWTVKTVNPDGVRVQRRLNGRGVDLNRNFPVGWRAEENLGSGYYQGPKPASEPETRGVMRLIRRLRPAVTIWYHQPWDQVLAPCRGSTAAEKLYARIARMQVNRCRGAHLPGTATRWQEHRIGGIAFVVELHGGELGDGEVRRHARAAARVATRFG